MYRVHKHVCIYFQQYFPILFFFMLEESRSVLRCVASLFDMLFVRCHCSNNRHENENEEFQSNTARAHLSLSLSFVSHHPPVSALFVRSLALSKTPSPSLCLCWQCCAAAAVAVAASL